MEENRKILNKVAPKLLCTICVSLLLVSLFSFIGLAGDASLSPSTDSNEKISKGLSSKLSEASAAEKIPVIIMLTNQHIPFNTAEGKAKIESEQKDLRKFLESEKSKNKVQKIKPIKLINAVAAEVTPEVLASLAERSDVKTIEPDDVVHLIGQSETSSEEIEASTTQQNIASTHAWGVDKIDAPAVWEKGITGKGITVAVVDTGIDATHPDLDDLDDNPSTNDPKVIGWIDYINSQSSPYDDHGHGTHVSGTISGTGANGIQTGVAPGTNLIVAKVFNAYGYGSTSDIILAFEWAVNNKARIISYSGGSYYHESAYTTAIDNVVAAGVTPVIAAGNSGPDSFTINCPGDENNSVTVGAIDSSELIAYFSSRGPVTLDGQTYVKPDVSAPGVAVTSTVPGGRYEAWDGTSMATPHVSGTVALMLENTPTLKPSNIKSTLESTAKDLGSTGKDNDYGSGLINASKAVGDTRPVVNFSAKPIEGKAPLNVTFTDKSTGNPTKWKWTFGDGTSSTAKNPTHKYSKVGSYNVNLTATNAVGNNTITKTGYIKVVTNPVANFTSNVTSGKAPLTVAFTDKSTGIPTSWNWTFGDGTNSIEQSPKHQYLQEGNYTVKLTVKNVAGNNTSTKTNYMKVTTNTKPGLYSINK